MKTDGHKNTDLRLAETRRLMMPETSPWCQPIRELSTGWSHPALRTPWNPSLPPSRVRHTVLKASAHYGPLCLAKKSNLLYSTSPKTLSVSIQHRWTEAKFWQQYCGTEKQPHKQKPCKTIFIISEGKYDSSVTLNFMTGMFKRSYYGLWMKNSKIDT